MKKIIILLILIVLTSCSKKEANEISENIYTQLKQSEWKVIDFSKQSLFNMKEFVYLVHIQQMNLQSKLLDSFGMWRKKQKSAVMTELI